MDPSAAICVLYDSLRQEPPVVPIETANQWYSQGISMALTPQYNGISVQSAPQAQYADANRYAILQKVKDAFETEGFIQARDATNSFENIGRSIFINRAAIKLANTDAVHKVSGQLFTFDNKTSMDPFTFCDVAAGPGGFTQYLQYRYKRAIGYGMTLRHETLDWNTRSLDMTRFTAFYGPDNTGNLYTNWEPFINYVLSKEENGVDLVTADGGFDLEDNMDKTLLHRQEFLSSRLLLTQAVIGVACAKIGGNFMVKVFDTVTTFSAHVLFVLAQCFERILIFKPISSRPANSERYVICMNKNREVQPYYQLLSGAARFYKDDIYSDTLFSEGIPQSFQQWLTESNNQSIARQLQAAQAILLYLKGTPAPLAAYDIEKFLVIWNLPDTPPHPRQTAIQIR